RARQLLRAARAVRVREDDDAADDRRFRRADRRRDLPRRARGQRHAPLQARRQHRLPELRALPALVDLRERRLRPAPERHTWPGVEGPGGADARARPAGRIRPAKAAAALGGSNRWRGTVAAMDGVRLDDGTTIRVPAESLRGRSGSIAVGIRPEKIRPDGQDSNVLQGVVKERAYIGVSTQYIVETRN